MFYRLISIPASHLRYVIASKKEWKILSGTFRVRHSKFDNDIYLEQYV